MCIIALLEPSYIRVQGLIFKHIQYYKTGIATYMIIIYQVKGWVY